MLCLDISGAFNNVCIERLIWIIRSLGFPEWTVKFIQSFLSGGFTQLSFSGFLSKVHKILTGIPQGSPLSPILFLLFAKGLLEVVNGHNAVAIAFVDDTNIFTCSPDPSTNCRVLEEVHAKAQIWATKHGAEFN